MPIDAPTITSLSNTKCIPKVVKKSHIESVEKNIFEGN